MLGLVLISHGSLAQALLETATEIVGPFDATETLAIHRQDHLGMVERRVREAVARVDRGLGVLVLVDMYGGTAANVALALVGERPLEVVTGCNLPMLLKLSSVMATATDVAATAQLLKAYGQRNVLVASEVLRERTS